jgi:hypothetical protein
MKAEMLRTISQQVNEEKTTVQLTASSRYFDSVMCGLQTAARKGERKCFVRMGAIHYSVLVRLLSLGYEIADSSDEGFCIVSW